MSLPPLPSLQHSRQTPQFLVTHQGDTLGPFETDFIEAMILARVYPASVLVQQIGTTGWVPFSSISGFVPTQDYHQAHNADNFCPPSPRNAGVMNDGEKESDKSIALIMSIIVRPFAKNNFRNPQKRLVRLFESFDTHESLVPTNFPILTHVRSKNLRRQWIVDVTTRRFGASTRCIYC